MKHTYATENKFKDEQKQADIQRLKKCIAELEVTARHFKVGDVMGGCSRSS